MSSQKASYKSQKLVHHIWHRIYSPQYDRQMDIKYIGILRKFHEIFSTFFREFTETCLVHLTRYLDLGLAAKDVKLSFWGQQYCFQMFIWWWGLALLQILNWRCISVVNPNNNLRSLKRSLSATLPFCRNINVNVMHTNFFLYERLLWRSLWKEWRLLILILSDASSRTPRRYFFLLLLINDLKLLVQYCYSSKLMLHVNCLEQLERKKVR